jgi:hypothetical protein
MQLDFDGERVHSQPVDSMENYARRIAMITRSNFTLKAVGYSIISVAAQMALAGTSQSAFAQVAVCGDPPPVANEALKGEIEGKAQFLSRFLGDASLAGRIETSRQEIFSQYPDQDERSDAYFEYMFCVLIMNDQDMTTQQKIDQLKEVKTDFFKLKTSRSGTNINVQNSKSVIIGDGNTMSTVGD